MKVTDSVFVKCETLEIVLKHDGCSYYVDLERLTTAAQALDWIFQLYGKGWCDADIACLEDAVEERFGQNLQGAFCPYGKNPGRKINWKADI
jgi:hypothetical protein